MASTTARRRYKLEELLGFRGMVALPGSVLEQLSAHPDIATAGSYGTAGGFDGTSDQRVPFYPSNSLSEITNQQKSQPHEPGHLYREGESRRAAEINTTREQQQQRHVHWNFRKRDSSDHSSQPHSAPTDIAAQQSENFQRFYRAVVSPTHVRVTAGGRIVPNTRASAPPLFDWNGDKFHTASHDNSTNHEQPGGQNPWSQSAALPTGYPSLMSSGFLPAFTVPQNNGSIKVPMMPPQIPSGPANSSSSTNKHRIPQMNEQAKASMLHNDLPPTQAIKISHPSQFDHTKPFTFNGHVVYPLPQGFQPPQNTVPLSINDMLGTNMMNQARSTIPQAPSFLPVQPPLLANPFMFPYPGQQHHMMIPYPGPASANMGHPLQAPTIPVSELLTTQIGHLLTQLRGIEEALATRSNPMGESLMLQHHAIINNQVSTLENILQNQLAQDELAKKRLIVENDQRQAAAQRDRSSVAVPSDKGTPTRKSDSDGQDLSMDEAPSSKQSAMKLDQAFKSRLRLAAAKAPPFKPRAKSEAPYTNTEPASYTGSPEGYGLIQSPETEEQIMARLLSKSKTDWGQSSIFNNDAKVSTLPRAQTFHEGTTEPQPVVSISSLQRSHTDYGSVSVPTSEVLTASPVPYLVGTLPRGVAASLVNPDDINYSRPLTDDEVRARYLYWGKAPRSVQSGLPKFDGKDFYPPSPVKEYAPIVSNHSHVSTLIDPNGTPGPLDFSTLFDGYKTPSPVHRLHLQNIRSLLPVYRPVFDKPITPVKKSSGQAESEQPTSSVPDTEELQTIARAYSSPEAAVQADGVPIDDFSDLFVVRSPSPGALQSALIQEVTNNQPKNSPRTPIDGNPAFRGSNDSCQMSRGRSLEKADGHAVQSPEDHENDDQSTVSTIEFQLSPRDKTQTFAQRVENFRTADQQSAFLQNMLRAQPSMTTSALSGAITSTNAQGFLPQYRGSAAASLAPTRLNISAVGSRDFDRSSPKAATGKMATGAVSPLIVSSILSENRAVRSERSFDGMGSEGLGAEGYMRYITKKNDTKKMLEQNWSHGGASENGW